MTRDLKSSMLILGDVRTSFHQPMSTARRDLTFEELARAGIGSIADRMTSLSLKCKQPRSTAHHRHLLSGTLLWFRTFKGSHFAGAACPPVAIDQPTVLTRCVVCTMLRRHRSHHPPPQHRPLHVPISRLTCMVDKTNNLKARLSTSGALPRPHDCGDCRWQSVMVPRKSSSKALRTLTSTSN